VLDLPLAEVRVLGAPAHGVPPFGRPGEGLLMAVCGLPLSTHFGH